jgi:hypothetical protein
LVDASFEGLEALFESRLGVVVAREGEGREIALVGTFSGKGERGGCGGMKGKTNTKVQERKKEDGWLTDRANSTQNSFHNHVPQKGLEQWYRGNLSNEATASP